MHCRFGFTREDFCEALEFVSRWHDAPEIGELVFSTLWEMADQLLPDGRAVLPDADRELLDRFQAEVAGYVRRYPEGPVKMIDPDNVDHAQMIWEQPKPHRFSQPRGRPGALRRTAARRPRRSRQPFLRDNAY